MSHEVTIIGAGIVGVSCGLALQAAGCRVRIFDPLEPGMATSFGNAGLISNKTILPNAMPGIWREIPGWLRDPCGPLRLRWTHLPFAAPWLLRFLACSSPGRVRRIADELAPLVGAATAAHQALIADHGIDAGLLRPGGILTLLRDWDGDRSMALEQDLWRRHDIDYEIVGRQAIEAMEPGISADYRFGLYHPGQHFVTEPIALTHAYAQAFRELGGVFLRERVVDIEFGADGPRQLITDVRRHALDRLVLAAGAWSKPLARKLGARVALESERGYHVRITTAGPVGLSRAVVCRRRALFSLPDERRCAIDQRCRNWWSEAPAGLCLGAPVGVARADRVVGFEWRNHPGVDGAPPVYTRFEAGDRAKPPSPAGVLCFRTRPSRPDAGRDYGTHHGQSDPRAPRTAQAGAVSGRAILI